VHHFALLAPFQPKPRRNYFETLIVTDCVFCLILLVLTTAWEGGRIMTERLPIHFAGQ